MKALYLLLLLVTFSSCSTINLFMEPKGERDASVEALPEVFHPSDDYQYRIRCGNKVSISVWGEDELSVGSVYGIYNSNEVYGKWLLVDAEGFIEVPRIGALFVLDMTVIELKKELKEKLHEWLVNPIVDIKILNKEITILGEVQNPKVIHLDEDYQYLLKVIARCQGFKDFADKEYIKVLREEGQHTHVANIDLSKAGNYRMKNIQLRPGDILIVPSVKNKEFDRRISNIIPFTSAATAAAILYGTLN